MLPENSASGAVRILARSRQSPVVTPEEEEGPDIGVYAGLGRRLVAFIVDIIIILLFDLVAMARAWADPGYPELVFLFRPARTC